MIGFDNQATASAQDRLHQQPLGCVLDQEQSFEACFRKVGFQFGIELCFIDRPIHWRWLSFLREPAFQFPRIEALANSDRELWNLRFQVVSRGCLPEETDELFTYQIVQCCGRTEAAFQAQGDVAVCFPGRHWLHGILKG